MTNEEEQYFRDMLSLVCAGCAYCWNSEKSKECLFGKLSERAIEALKERPHGEWNPDGTCSVCGVYSSLNKDTTYFCSNCGSDNRKRGVESEM